jgi:hypothetical protein
MFWNHKQNSANVMLISILMKNVFTGGNYQDPQDAETNHQCSATNRTGGYPEKYVSS